MLQRREELRTRGWLETGIKLRASRVDDPLLAMFERFHDWFLRGDVEGCTLMNLLLESSVEANIRDAALTRLARLRLLITNLADEADSLRCTKICGGLVDDHAGGHHGRLGRQVGC